MIAQIDLVYLNNSEEFFATQGSCAPAHRIALMLMSLLIEKQKQAL